MAGVLIVWPDIRVFVDVHETELLEPQDAVLERGQAEAIALADQHLSPQNLVPGEGVALELEPMEIGRVPLLDIKDDADALMDGVEALHRHHLSVDMAEVAVAA